jgi:hypothetical protein
MTFRYLDKGYSGFDEPPWAWRKLKITVNEKNLFFLKNMFIRERKQEGQSTPLLVQDLFFQGPWLL